MNRRRWMSLAAAAPLAAQNPPRELIAPYRARTIDGLTFTRDSLKGKVVLVQHWATWCQYCRKDEAAVEQVIKEHTQDGLVVLAINSGESRDKVKEYLQDHPRTAHIVLTPDTNLAVLFQDVGVPAYLLIDRDAKLAAGQPGAGGILALRQLLKEAGIEKK